MSFRHTTLEGFEYFVAQVFGVSSHFPMIAPGSIPLINAVGGSLERYGTCGALSASVPTVDDKGEDIVVMGFFYLRRCTCERADRIRLGRGG